VIERQNRARDDKLEKEAFWEKKQESYMRSTIPNKSHTVVSPFSFSNREKV